METFLKKNKSFQNVYEHVILMSKDREGLMNMITDMLANEDIAGSINRTNESIIKRLRREIKEKETVLKKKDAALKEKDALIRELQKQLAAKKSD